MVDEKPSKKFNIQIPDEAKAIFCIATKTTIGNGMKALFWEDCWLRDGQIREFAPHLFVIKRAIQVHSVRDGLVNDGW